MAGWKNPSPRRKRVKTRVCTRCDKVFQTTGKFVKICPSCKQLPGLSYPQNRYINLKKKDDENSEAKRDQGYQ